VRLNHVTLAVTDIERAVDFYKRLVLRQIVATTRRSALRQS
jgi:catechol 2,3-dioxygenase-like lactoylglutathione lyase family enzyme